MYIFLLISLISATQTYLNESYQWQSNLSEGIYTAMTWGDINGDRYIDLILSGHITFPPNVESTRVYINNYTTLTENSTWQQNLTSVNYGSLSLGDIDNDGDLDLALAGCNNGADFVDNCESGKIRTKIYLNNGTSFTESSQWQQNLTAVYRPGSLTFADIDNDGNLDLGLNGQTESSITSKIYLNNGTSFTESSQWQSNLTALRKASLAFGDIDNDGDLDLITSGRDSSDQKLTEVYLNNGTSFIENSQWGTNLVNVEDSSLALADFDNDGDLDLSLFGCCDIHRIYRNNGSTFIEINRESTGDLVGVFAGSQAFGDYDNDGYLDLITNGREKYTTLYLYNTSSLNFTNNILDPTEPQIANVMYGSLAWIDLENDTDLDLIETGYDTQVRDYVYVSNRSLTKNNTFPTPPNTFTSSYINNILTLTWNNGSDNETPSTGLYYNLMVGNSTTNHTVVSGVYGGSSNPTAGYFGNMMQRRNITLNVQLEANKTYNWYVQTIDTGLAKSNWSSVQSFTTSLDTTKPNISIENPSPTDGLHTTNPFFIFNATVTDANLSNVSLYADWTGSMIINQTNSTGINGTYIFEKNLTNINDGMYSWYIVANDTYNNSQTSGTRSFYLDRAYPLVYLESPANASTWSSSSTITFSYNVTDTDIANCSLVINGAIDQTDTSITENISQSFTKTLSNADYTWDINCTDYVNYINNSETRSLTVSYTAPSGNGGGGGSGGGITTITPTPEVKEFDIDFSKASGGTLEAQQGNVKTFTFNSQVKHFITLLTVTTNSITLLITSNPITVQINLGETKQIDINEDDINDFEIKLISILNGMAKFSLNKLAGADIVAKEELGKEALFDVKVSVENLFQIVKSGREVIAKIEVFNVNNIGQVDVQIDYYLTTKDDNKTKLAEGSDTLSVEAVASFVRSLNVPYNLKSGNYLFNVDVKYKDKIMASGNVEFRVIKTYEIFIAIGIIVLIVVGIFFYLWRIKKKEEKDVGVLKREIRKLKKESLRQRWKKWRNKRGKNGRSKNR